MSKHKINDFFCGAGGMSLGFKQAGFEIAGAWDFDKYAVQTYKANVGDHVKQADITQMMWSDVPKADVWTFGFPCQDLSVAGKRAGLFEGKRSGLFFEVMRLLGETRKNAPDNLPAIIMAENVKGLRPYLDVLKEEYRKQGYIMKYALFNSKYWGVPQNRERYFVVGIREDLPQDFNFPIQQTDFIPKLSSVLQESVDEKYYISEEKAQKIIDQALQQKVIESPFIEQNNEPIFYPATVDGISHALNTRPRCHPSELNKKVGKVVIEPIVVSNKATKLKGAAEQSHTLLARDYKGFGNQEMNAVLHGHRVRRLTPREYARLQGFPDDFKQVVSDTQFYKQMGNAVTVNVAKAIAGNISEYLNRLSERE